MLIPKALILLLANSLAVYATSYINYNTHDYYVLEHDDAGLATVTECAHALGLEVIDKVGELANHWLARISRPQIDSRSEGDRVLRRYDDLRQRAVSDVRRSMDSLHARKVVSSVKFLERQHLKQRIKRDGFVAARQEDADKEKESPSRALAQRLGIKDPIFSRQWHIVNDDYPEHNMNVTALWETGVTGKGVISAMVDDGLDYESNDLADNFDAEGSYDFNDHIPLPKPKLWDDHHGTRCAGEIAAVKNDVCGVGLAYESKVAGVRILSGPISDVDEAAALNYGYQNTSIYSCSWGPPDNGLAMEGPSLLIQKAVLNGINKGRAGKGSVFVFAAGNGAASGDQCNFDGYTNSIYSVTVASVDHQGKHPSYSEACAANMVVTYSSGGGEYIHTTDVGKDKCAHGHGGTSAAAPMAVGVFALALSVRPDLTWRDIQHLCVNNAVKINAEDPDWESTFNGRGYSYKYGWGVLNAGRYVEAARNWKLVKPQAWLHTDVIELNGAQMNETSGAMSGGEPLSANGVRSTTTITKAMLKEANVERLEHVNLRVWASHTRRGDLEVEIVSPAGVKSVLAAKRRNDDADTGYPGWMFMTVKHWGESGVGDWTIRVSDQGSPESTGKLLGWSMMLWGESIDPKMAKLYQLPDQLPPLPPQDDSTSTSTMVSSSTTSEIMSASTTRLLTKPTAALPGDHGEAEGESHKPAFPQDDDASTTPTGTPEEGWFDHINDLLSSKTWLFGSLALVLVFAAGTGAFFWRRSRRRRAGDYTAVGSGAVGMSAMERGSSSGARSKELYDAFGEVSDDDADEEDALVRGKEGRAPGFHSGFLEDDEEEEKERYRDNPDGSGVTITAPHHARDDSADQPPREAGTSDTSGDGSWVDAR